MPPWIPACAGTNGVSDSACVTISQSLILMVRRRGAPSRTMRPGIATLDWWPHPSRRPPSLALRRAPQDEVLGLRGQRPADLKNRKSVPIASSSLANAPPPGRGRAPGFALPFFPSDKPRGVERREAHPTDTALGEARRASGDDARACRRSTACNPAGRSHAFFSGYFSSPGRAFQTRCRV